MTCFSVASCLEGHAFSKAKGFKYNDVASRAAVGAFALAVTITAKLAMKAFDSSADIVSLEAVTMTGPAADVQSALRSPRTHDTSLSGALMDTFSSLRSSLPAVSVVSNYPCPTIQRVQSMFLMAIMLFFFGQMVWSSALELKRMLNVMTKLDSEAQATTASASPMVPKKKRRPPVCVQPEAGRRSHSVPASRRSAAEEPRRSRARSVDRR